MDNKELLRRARQGDQEARNLLIQDNIRLVWSIVRRFSGRGYETEELFQIGCIGLIKAADQFDEQYEVRFSTYAVPLITGEIKRFLRDDGMVRVSRSIKENGWKIKKEVEKLRQKNGREPTLEEIAVVTDLPMEELTLAMEACTEVESIDRPVYQKDGSETTLADQLSDGGNGMKDVDRMMNRMVLEQVLNELGKQEKSLIIKRYFEEKTQTETGRELGISQVQVSRMEKKI